MQGSRPETLHPDITGTQSAAQNTTVRPDVVQVFWSSIYFHPLITLKVMSDKSLLYTDSRVLLFILN